MDTTSTDWLEARSNTTGEFISRSFPQDRGNTIEVLYYEPTFSISQPRVYGVDLLIIFLKNNDVKRNGKD